MWGKVTGDSSMEARGNLMLAMLARTLDNYFLMERNNVNQPPNFVGNKVTGIVSVIQGMINFIAQLTIAALREQSRPYDLFRQQSRIHSGHPHASSLTSYHLNSISDLHCRRMEYLLLRFCGQPGLKSIGRLAWYSIREPGLYQSPGRVELLQPE